MDNINYDIAIRTVGRGGEKYQALLDSIAGLNPQPQAVYVILPEGATPPDERNGNEAFVYAPKGMMTQRIAALKYCTSEYILLLDDDLRFDGSFVAKLYDSLCSGNYGFAIGELLDLLPAERGVKHILPILSASAVPAINNRKDWFVTILKSGGWTYNRFLPTAGKVLPTQSGAGAMFFCKRQALEKLYFEGELWAQHEHLAPAEDQIMFYKAHLKGLGVCVATDAHYDHLDAKASRPSEEAMMAKTFWSGYNNYVFWKRFIYDQQKNIRGRFVSIIAYSYRRFWGQLMYAMNVICRPKRAKYDKEFTKGVKSGRRFAKTEEYRNLPPVQ